MSAIAASLLLIVTTTVAGTPAPKYPISKDTTYITEPLDKQRYVDYETALNDRLGNGILPDKNANVHLWKALGPRPEESVPIPPAYFKRLGIVEPPPNGQYFVGLKRFLHDQFKIAPNQIDAIFTQLDRATQRPWSPKDYPQIAAWLKANEKPLAVAAEATRLPDYYNPIVSNRKENGPSSLIAALSPSVSSAQQVCSALTARAMLRLAEGRSDDAWHDLLASHRLSRIIGRGATLLEALVGIAIDHIVSTAELAYLDRAGLNAEQLKNCLKDLHGLSPMRPLPDIIDLDERYVFLDTVQLIHRGGVTAIEELAWGSGTPRFSVREKAALASLDWEPAMRTCNKWCDRVVAAMRIKDRDGREKEFDRMDTELRAWTKAAKIPEAFKALLAKQDAGKEVSAKLGEILIATLFPGFRNAQAAADRAEQTRRNLHLAFVLATYQSDHGRYPAKLDDLVPKYVLVLPGDLFSGKALTYRPSDRGYLLYSVGQNKKDDGGRWLSNVPPGDDLSVQTPLPELKKGK